MEALATCCKEEAQRSLRKHRQVATCDRCDSLILAYGNDVDYQLTVDELANADVPCQVGEQGRLRIVAYRRP